MPKEDTQPVVVCYLNDLSCLNKQGDFFADSFHVLLSWALIFYYQ